MFFNDDILFRNGRLALVWRAGNGDFKNAKGRIPKEYRSLLKVSVITVCAEIRKLLPMMGTAHGIGLKKMGTLVKGVGTIYSLKIDNLAREIVAATKLNRPTRPGGIDARINAEPDSKSKGSKKVPPPEPSVVADEFGKLPIAVNADENGEATGRFGLLIDSEDFFRPPRGMPSIISDYPTFHLIVPSPARSVDNEEEDRQERSRRKRRRDEDNELNEEAVQEELIHKLQRFVDVNARAHCLLEDDQPLLPPVDDQQQLDLDFGGEQGILDILNMADINVAGSMEPQEQPQSPLLVPQGEPTVSGMLSPSIGGPPTDLELEIRSKVLETPPGAGTRPENGIRRRLIGGHEPNITLDELEGSPQGERARGRIRRRILIDEDISIPPKQMLDRISALRSDTSMSLLQQRLIETRAPGKSAWKTIPRGIQLIAKAGRGINCAALQEFHDGMLNTLIRGPENPSLEKQREPASAQPTLGRLQEIPEASIEDERARNASTDIGVSAGTTGLHGERTAAEIAPGSPQPQVYEDYPLAGGDAERVGMDDGMYQPMDVQFSPRAEPNPFAKPEAVPRKRKRESGMEDLARRMEFQGQNTFVELFPPNTARKEAALGFFVLLKMQARKELLMHQDEPYGPIIIEKLNLRSQ